MSIWLWTGFLVLILAFLALDLGVFHRRPRAMGVRQALGWTAVWVGLSLLFALALYFVYEHDWLVGRGAGPVLSGHEAVVQYLTGYVVEQSLSLDNIFLFVVIFSYFRVPSALQHRLLFWGILGALVLRGGMILAGAALLARFDWITYVFGAFLIGTAIRMLVVEEKSPEPERNLLVRLAKRLFPVSRDYEGDRFFTRVDGRRAATPLLLVLLLVESSDVLFAVDSIPAVFAVTRDPFLVFTSNVFAILGLRSLFFALARVLERFRYLEISLVFVLCFVGVKMLLSEHVAVPSLLSLAVILGILAAGFAASLIRDGGSGTSANDGGHEEKGR